MYVVSARQNEQSNNVVNLLAEPSVDRSCLPIYKVLKSLYRCTAEVSRCTELLHSQARGTGRTSPMDSRRA